ncbi:MAG: hypothetical protein AAF756_21115 [Pseudomonadota bacterium]
MPDAKLFRREHQCQVQCTGDRAPKCAGVTWCKGIGEAFCGMGCAGSDIGMNTWLLYVKDALIEQVELAGLSASSSVFQRRQRRLLR